MRLPTPAHLALRVLTPVEPHFPRGINPDDSPLTAAARREQSIIRRRHRVDSRTGNRPPTPTPPLEVLRRRQVGDFDEDDQDHLSPNDDPEWSPSQGGQPLSFFLFHMQVTSICDPSRYR